MKTPTEIFAKIKEDKKNMEFLPTGFKKLDDFLDGGFLRKELVVLGAYAGVGKSFLAGNIFYNIAKGGFKSAYFSLEISNEMIISRLAGALSNIKPTRIMAGFLTAQEYESKLNAESDICVWDGFMYLYDDLYKLSEIEKEIRGNEYEFVVIDFIQNIMMDKGDEYERLSHISLALQKLAKETNCCILVLSQLSNAAAKQGAMEYKGSGSIITVCDLGFFLRRSEVDGDQNSVELELKKNRRGFQTSPFYFNFQQPGGLLTDK